MIFFPIVWFVCSYEIEIFSFFSLVFFIELTECVQIVNSHPAREKNKNGISPRNEKRNRKRRVFLSD